MIFRLKANLSQAGSFIGASGPGAAVETLTGNSGGVVAPTLNNINLLGDTTTITTVGNPGTSTITFEFVTNPNVVGTLTAGTGLTATAGNITAAAGNINATLGAVSAGTTVTAGTSISSGTSITSGTGLTAGTTLTVDSFSFGALVSNGVGQISSIPGVSGQILTSNGPGVSPSFQSASASGAVTSLVAQDTHSVTPTAGAINISGGNNLTTTGTVGPNTLTISLAGITQHSLQVGGAASALTQLGVATNGQLPIGSAGADPVLATLTAGAGISVTNGAGSITIAATGSGFTWHDVTGGAATLAAENGYIADSASLTTFTMPTNNTFGDTIKIVGKGSGGWKIVYGAGQNIIFGNAASTITTGNIASTNANDCVELVCTTTSVTAPIFTVVNSVGNILIT